MATLIICPACETRYEVKAAFPPEGRKVRCTKCGHVWQALPQPQPGVAPAAAPTAPHPQAAPRTAPPPPQAAPRASTPQPASPPRAAPPPPRPFPSASPPHDDAEFETDGDVAAQVARMNAEAMQPAPKPAIPKQGGLFAKIMGKSAAAAPDLPAPEGMAPEAPPPPPSDTNYIPAGSRDASFDSSYPEGEEQDAALADPDLVAAAFGKAPPKTPRKPLPIVAIGWGLLALLVAVVAGLFAFAPGTTVSMLPGAARVYSLLGIPVGSQGLAFEGVRYGWTSDGSQTVLEVQGNVRNTSSTTMAVPTVVIALRDEKGEEISEWTTEVGATELSAGEEAPFLRQIPSPPSNVRSLKVRFAKAN